MRDLRLRSRITSANGNARWWWWRTVVVVEGFVLSCSSTAPKAYRCYCFCCYGAVAVFAAAATTSLQSLLRLSLVRASVRWCPSSAAGLFERRNQSDVVVYLVQFDVYFSGARIFCLASLVIPGALLRLPAAPVRSCRTCASMGTSFLVVIASYAAH